MHSGAVFRVSYQNVSEMLRELIEKHFKSRATA